MSARASLVLLVGPTASGKTALACALAQALDAEVLSADSQQGYRGLDVGTAKPSLEERARARHHLLDLAWPEEQLDAARFVAQADAAIAEVRSRGKRVLVAGGTGLWIRALVRGLVEAPGRDEAFRARFRERLEQEGLPAMFAELERIDPEAAQRILPGDRVRIERALEVHAKSGQTLSSLQRAHRFAERRYRARVVLLDPPRELLWQRIEQRTRAFFAPEAGSDGVKETRSQSVDGTQRDRVEETRSDAHAEGPLIREARWLRARAQELPAAARALGIIGYGEASLAIDRGLTEASLREARETVAARTRQYAKRQRTWFKKDAPALDETGAPLAWPPADLPERGGALHLERARDALCSILRGWYEDTQ